MVDFVNKLDTSYQKYQTNENVRYENYKGNLSYPMKDFVSFGTDFQSVYFMSTIFLKYKINDSVFHNFNFLTFATQIIPRIRTWLICVMKYIIFGGGTNNCNYVSESIA